MGLLGAIANPPKSDDKYVEKSVQLVRGSSFRNDMLQNSYFKRHWHLLRMLKGPNIIALLFLKENEDDKLKMPFNCSLPQKPDTLLTSIFKQTPNINLGSY